MKAPAELHALAGMLNMGLHKAAVLSSTRFPHGMWICSDGRKVLFDRAYHPIWQRLPSGELHDADADEWVEDIKRQVLFFEDGRHVWTQYHEMLRLADILRSWGLRHARAALPQERKSLKRVRLPRKRPPPRDPDRRLREIDARDDDGNRCTVYLLPDGRYASTLYDAHELLAGRDLTPDDD